MGYKSWFLICDNTTIRKIEQRYCSKAYSRSGVNQMSFLKNSIELLENLKSHDFFFIDSVKTYDFSTLYTTILQHKLKSQLFSDHKYFFKQIGHPEIQNTCFERHHSDRPYKYSEAVIKSMLCLAFL
jgi:hypothetical protein